MGALEETKYILKKYGIKANKKLGQNFLIDDNVIQATVDSAEIGKNDLVIEIGPGLGTLTKLLLEKAKRVVAIELDARMIEILNDRFNLYKNFEVINNDVLKVNLNDLIKEQKEKYNIDKVKIVANLPYYITTPIIMKLLEDRLNIESITVMVQKEVAKRLTAIPGDRESGAITYSVNYYATQEEIIEVSKDSFIPAPEVDSEVIKLTLRDKPEIELKDEELFFKIIKAGFMQRRKTLINGLSNSGIVNKDKIREILVDLGIDVNIRGENLGMQEFANIANKISI